MPEEVSRRFDSRSELRNLTSDLITRARMEFFGAMVELDGEIVVDVIPHLAICIAVMRRCAKTSSITR